MLGHHVSLVGEHILGYVAELQEPVMAMARVATSRGIAHISEGGLVKARYILLLPPKTFKLQLKGALLLPLVEDLVAEELLSSSDKPHS